MAKIIAFTNQKGGVGKTTTAVNMAAYCAEFGKRVLLVDIDSQGNATTALGFSKSSLKKSVHNVLVEDDSASANIIPTQVKLLDILPANVDLSGAEVDLVYKRNRERILKEALDKVRGNYDYIFIDCPPSLGLLTINAWVAADSVIIPLQSEYFAGREPAYEHYRSRPSEAQPYAFNRGSRNNYVRRQGVDFKADSGGNKKIL